MDTVVPSPHERSLTPEFLLLSTISQVACGTLSQRQTRWANEGGEVSVRREGQDASRAGRCPFLLLKIQGGLQLGLCLK